MTWAALVLLAATAVPEAALVDVIFLPQGRLLCGGASVAMVMRYWGAENVYAEDFQDLVDEDEGGISTADLVNAVRARHWRALPIRADRDSVRLHLSGGRPLVALLRSSENRLHYVVLMGYSGDELVLHDPSLGPNRLRSFESVFESWADADFWALLVLPAESRRMEAHGKEDPEVVEAESNQEAVVLRERAAKYFLEEEWSQSAEWARAALEIAPKDDHARSILAASLYLSGDREGALEAWNLRGEPTLDRVEIGGLAHPSGSPLPLPRGDARRGSHHGDVAESEEAGSGPSHSREPRHRAGTTSSSSSSPPFSVGLWRETSMVPVVRRLG